MRVSRVVKTPDEIKADMKQSGVDASGIEQAMDHMRQAQQEAQKAYNKGVASKFHAHLQAQNQGG
jgi:SOS response regulatory protein OraA/RecX